jgi:predicted RNase H-like nuclease (RuvC/YqgF family)
MPGSHHEADPGAQSAREHELERRLHEQTKHNSELDSEVRYLQQELKVRNEFVTELEAEVASLHELLGKEREGAAEFSAYRNRVSHRTVDGIINRIQRTNWLYRPLRGLGHTLMARRGRSRGLPVVEPRLVALKGEPAVQGPRDHDQIGTDERR